MLTAWLCILFSAVLFIDSLGIEKLENQTVLELKEKQDFISGGNFGRSSIRTFMTLETANNSFAIDPYSVRILGLKSDKTFSLWRSHLLHQKIKLQVEDKTMNYSTVTESLYGLIIAQGLLALISFVTFIPGQARVYGILISAVLSLYTLLTLIFG
jgi:hypothetical protein